MARDSFEQKGRMYHSTMQTWNGWNSKLWKAVVASHTGKFETEPVQQHCQVSPRNVDARRGLAHRKWPGSPAFPSCLPNTFCYCHWENSDARESFGTSIWSWAHPQESKHWGQGSTGLSQHSTLCFFILSYSACHRTELLFVNFLIILECLGMWRNRGGKKDCYIYF